MRLYLDDDIVDPRLIRFLEQAGHDVQIPAEASMRGWADAVHLTHAIRNARIVMSHNRNDFRQLHDLIIAASGHHPGILIAAKDNDPTRDMTLRGIVHAIGKVVASGIPVADDFIVLNQWR